MATFQNSLIAEQNFRNASTADSEMVLTKSDVFNKTMLCIAITSVCAIIGAYVIYNGLIPSNMIMGLTMASVFATIGLGIANAFKMCNPSRGLILSYCAIEGFLLGMVSIAYSYLYNGIVIQAVLGTAAITWVASILSKRLSSKSLGSIQKFIMIALPAYMVFALINFVLSMLGVFPGYGVYSMGPLGFLVSLFAIVLGAVMLVRDFANVSLMVGRAPSNFAWSLAYAIILDIIWIYLEILRLLAIFSRRN